MEKAGDTEMPASVRVRGSGWDGPGKEQQLQPASLRKRSHGALLPFRAVTNLRHFQKIAPFPCC